jgi:hypothetical protein
LFQWGIFWWQIRYFNAQEKPQSSALRFCRSRGKGSALKNLAGALPTEAVRWALSVSWEVKMEIPVYWLISTP